MMAASGSTDATYLLTGDASSVDEGAQLTITVTTTNVPNNTVLYWSITQNPGDFSVTQGNVTITSGSTTFTVTPTADQTTEGTEYFTVTLYTDSARTQSVAVLSGVAINDTSTTPPAYFYIHYHAYGTHMGDMNVYWVTTGVNATATLLSNPVNSTTRPTHSADTDEWTQLSLNLGSYMGETGRIAIVHSDYSGYASDLALSQGKYEDSSGNITYYEGSDSTNRARWRHTNNGSASSPAAAALITSVTTLGQNTNGRWGYDGGGPTPSSNTGPDMDSSNNSGKDYIYFEGSGAPSNGNPQALKWKDAVTLA